MRMRRWDGLSVQLWICELAHWCCSASFGVPVECSVAIELGLADYGEGRSVVVGAVTRFPDISAGSAGLTAFAAAHEDVYETDDEGEAGCAACDCAGEGWCAHCWSSGSGGGGGTGCEVCGNNSDSAMISRGDEDIYRLRCRICLLAVVWWCSGCGGGGLVCRFGGRLTLDWDRRLMLV
jgi:hypothetical protein